MKFTIEEFLERLPLPATDKWKDGVWDLEPFEKNNVKLVFFAPRGIDYQTSHEDDEFYFISRGTAKLIIANDSFACTAGDERNVEHHFEDISDDFATWAIFF